MDPYWLRLERKGTLVMPSVSPDGEAWVKVGEAAIPMGPSLSAGLAVSSALPTVTTSVRFDHVKLP
jgi:regulation of enolase protein 1 (concanavalin A-like superfamily)